MDKKNEDYLIKCAKETEEFSKILGDSLDKYEITSVITSCAQMTASIAIAQGVSLLDFLGHMTQIYKLLSKSSEEKYGKSN